MNIVCCPAVFAACTPAQLWARCVCQRASTPAYCTDINIHCHPTLHPLLYPYIRAAYGMGCFHDLSMVAFASDAVIDLIPVDTTAALVVASAAAGLTHATRASSDEGRARVYCAASAHSYPQSAPSLFERANKWWTLNPSPFKLPLARWVVAGASCST